MATPTCENCGAPLHGEGVGGICPKCLLHGTTAEGTAPRPEPPPIEVIAENLPNFEILELIGYGGMGFVYRARQRKLERIVAIKVLPSDRATHPELRERFLREARTLASLSHTNIVPIYDVGESEDFVYFVMEYVEGASLAELIHAGELSPGEALQLVPQMCDALEFAHEHGVVHRDIKPANILLDQTGRVKIADFGIAKLLSPAHAREGITRTGDFAGTVGYSAPEHQENTQGVDHRADIYSLGAVIYEMLTGELPVGAFAPPSKKVQVDVRLDEVVLRALDAKPECRYQHANEVKEEVEEIANGRASRRPRHKYLAAGLFILLIFLAALLIFGPRGSDGDRIKADAAPKPPPGKITVLESKEAYESLALALRHVLPGQTIRVTGEAVHSGPVLFNNQARHHDVTLEGTEGATLRWEGSQLHVGVINVSGVTIRGFNLTYRKPPPGRGLPPLVVAGGHSPGLTLENLTLEGALPAGGTGISLENLQIKSGEPPMRVRNCSFRHFTQGVRISGIDAKHQKPMPGRGALITDNEFQSCSQGLSIYGEIRDAVVSGNRFQECSEFGIRLQNLFPGAGNILVANNTLFQCGQAVRLFDDGPIDGESIRFANNLSLESSGDLDWGIYDMKDPEARGGLQPGDASSLPASWAMDHNYRESPGPPAAAKWKPAWIAPGPENHHKKALGGINRDPKSPAFLRPEKSSPLARDGAGEALPSYVGALPPEGTLRHEGWSIPAQP